MTEAALYSDPPPPDADSLERIGGVVYRLTGIRLGPGKDYFIAGRLKGLYRRFGCRGWGDLPPLLEDHADLAEILVQSVVTGETSFFRDRIPFRALRYKVVPEVSQGSGEPTRLRVWSAGCSSGQEAYSAAMSLWDEVEAGQVDLDVWATDISAAALERAREGVYAREELRRGLGEDEIERFFDPVGDRHARVRPQVRSRVRFSRMNLISDDPPRGCFHAVFCRNVAIYFDTAARTAAYRRLSEALVPGGYLLLGAAETLFPSLPSFETVYFERHLLFRKRLDARD